MKTGKESLSFGRYLQSLRLEKKISLERVSEETRIAIGNLRLIEKEDLETLPDEVFVKGFLRAYARAIGADGEKAVKLYRARLNMESRLADAGSFSPKSSFSAWRNLILAVMAVAAVIVLTLYGVSYLERRTPEVQIAETSADTAHLEAAPHRHEATSTAKSVAAPESSEKLVLLISAVEDTWIKVIVDNQDASEINLKSGEKLEMEASAGFNLLIGNATGLELKFNGKPVKISGKAGEVVNVQLP